MRAREIYRRLSTHHEITLVTGNYPGAFQGEQDGMRFVRVGSGQSYVRSRLSYCRQAAGWLKQLVWDVWVHEFSAFAPLWVRPCFRGQGILFFYHFVGHHALLKHPLVGGVAWLAEALTLRGYRRILTISPSLQQQVRARLAGRPVQVDCVFTGVDARYFSLYPEEQPYVLFFGRTDVHTKGLDVLVKAFARVAPAYSGLQLKIAGRGRPSQVRRLQWLVQAEGLADRVELIGEVGEEQKGELLRQALFICMPSRYEGWGIAALEAAAVGKAVVGTRIAGLQDAVCEGRTGILVKAGCPAALAAGMQRLLDKPDLRHSLGAGGRVWARRFDWERIARDQEELYLQAAAENRSR